MFGVRLLIKRNVGLVLLNAVDKIEIWVYNLNGRQVYNNQGNANQEYRFGSELQSGLYFASVVQGNETRQVKLIKRI